MVSSSSRVSASMRARSVATLPLPITTARSQERSNSSSAKSGWALYQATKAVAGWLPSQVLAGDPEPAVGGRAVGVDHGVVALGELGGAHVAPDLDVAEEAEALARRGLLVDPDHRLDLRVVGRDAGTHQPEGRRQAVEDVHLDGARAPASAGARRRRSPPARSRRSRRAGGCQGVPGWSLMKPGTSRAQCRQARRACRGGSVQRVQGLARPTSTRR